MTYPYILPPLPYAPAALEPNLGRSSVRLHHDTFFAAYVDRLNGALVPWTQYQDWPLERLLLHWCQLPRTLGQAVRHRRRFLSAKTWDQQRGYQPVLPGRAVL